MMSMFLGLGLGLALVSVGCSERSVHRQWDRMTGRDRDRVDINSASERQLARLPGITDEDAGRIIANRPYPDKEALVRRGVIGPRKYDAIEDYVYASGRRYRDDDRNDDRYRDDDRYDHR
jgi:predicted DNA-binding helix-hairpin-helix protein